ncbi:MAG: DUF937 domain-containing protein [Gammaproteobacteria bacterium]|nr:DUF937 domain-containing protein [Gammaproteobacteria bacterium]
MNILEMMLGGQDAGQLGRLAGQFGIDEGQARSALEQLVPALSRGMRRNVQSSEGLESLTRALEQGNHRRYVEDPGALADPHTVDDGNAILGHLFGSKKVSREVAGRAAAQTGLDSGLLKQMLPIIASMMMGSMSSQAQAGGMAPTGVRKEGMMDILGGFLDADKDGSIADDLFGMASRIFR